MGGAIHAQGNITPHHVEANFAHDPKALQQAMRIAQEHAIPITIVPLDVTENPGLELTIARLESIANQLHARESQNMADMLVRLAGSEATYPNFYRKKRGVYYHAPPYDEHIFQGSPIHDLTAVMAQKHPELFHIVTRPVVIDEYGALGIPTAWMESGVECSIVLDIKDPEHYWKIATNYLASYR